MTGRAFLIGTLVIGLGLAGVTRRVDAQSDLGEEDVSTGEISNEETSSTELGSDDISSDDHFSDDSFSTDKGDRGIARPPKPEHPEH